MDSRTPKKQSVKDYEVFPSKPTSRALVSSSAPKTPQKSNQNQIIPNRFSPLQNIPEIPFNTVLASNIPKSANIQIPNTPEEHKYFAKDWHEDCGMTPFSEFPARLSQIDFIKNRFQNPSLLWETDDCLKDQRYYEFILVDSDSVEITHIYNRAKEIEYSKCIIKRVHTVTTFGGLHEFKIFNHPAQGYNYIDYKNAWFRAFLLRYYNHSWFITFHHNCEKQFPVWFPDWWRKMGSSIQILPFEVQKGFNTFAEVSTLKNFQKFIMFHAEFKVPWIFAWDFNFEKIYPDPTPYSLTRVYKVKWWAKFQNHIGAEPAVKQFFTTGEKVVYQKENKGKEKTGTSKKSSNAELKPDCFMDNLPEHIKKDFFEFMAQKSVSSKSKSEESVSSDPIGGQDPYDFDPFRC